MGVLTISSHQTSRIFEGDAKVVIRPPCYMRNDFYISNREPLLPSILIELPFGAIKPKGWLQKQLELEADGYPGRLEELSIYLTKKGNAWLSVDGQGHSGWEEVPYWLRGYLPLAYLLQDEKMIRNAYSWIEAILNSGRADGWFGPDANLIRNNGQPDIMPNMIAQFALEDYYDYTGDERVIELLTGFSKYLLDLPEDHYLSGSWQKKRGGDQLWHILWLYNRTGKDWLLDVAEKTHQRTLPWVEGLVDNHNVNIMQGMREPVTWGLFSGVPAHFSMADVIYQAVYDRWGQVPGGGFCGDDFLREGHTDPLQGLETCGMVEMMLSAELLLCMNGDLQWADRCEDMTFNSYASAATADFKALRYHTAPNMPQSDNVVKYPTYGWGGWHDLSGTWMNPHAHRCCLHNSGMGWPYFVKHQWYATPDNGLAAVFYSANEVTAMVGTGVIVSIEEKTQYPFDEQVEFIFNTPSTVEFPFYLRIPGWCNTPTIRINGNKINLNTTPGHYIQLTNKWKNGDTVSLELPRQIKVHRWTANKNSASVQYGPLFFSLKIKERKEVTNGIDYPVQLELKDLCEDYDVDMMDFFGTDEWPAFDLLPDNPWNYALVLDDNNPAAGLVLQQRRMPSSDMPFTQEGSPLIIKALAKRLPDWKLSDIHLVEPLPMSPTCSQEPLEIIELIPMGATRLRISAFPVISENELEHKQTSDTLLNQR